MIEKIILPAVVITGITPTGQSDIHKTNIQNEANFYQEVNCFTKQEIQDIVISICVDKLGINPKRINSNSDFSKDLGADSLDVVELIMEFEKKFNIAIPDEKAENMSKIADAVNYIYEQYINAVSLFSETDFSGNKKCIINKTTEYEYNSKNYTLVDGGLSSIVVPSGYTVILYTDKNYEGETVRIIATDKRVEIKNLSELKEHKSIEISDPKIKWNDNVKSVTIEKN